MANMAQANTAGYPEEVLSHIFAELQRPINVINTSCSDDWYQSGKLERLTLLAICRTSRQFRRIAQPLLYHALPTIVDLPKTVLIRTLRDQPELSKSVRILKWGYYCPEGNQTRGSQQSGHGFNRLVHTHFQQARQWVDESDEFLDTLSNAILQSPPDYRGIGYGTEIALFLLMTPNLKVLDLGVFSVSGHRASLLRCMFEHAAWSLNTRAFDDTMPLFGPLLRLEQLRINKVRFSWIEFMLAHPGVSTLRLFESTWQASDVSTISTRPPYLKHLYCFECVIDVEGIADILTRFPNLETLQIIRRVVDGIPVDYHIVGDCLRRFGKHLKRLTLWKDIHNTKTGCHPRGRIGSLKDLVYLTDLSIYYSALVLDNNKLAKQGDYVPLPLDLCEVLPTSLERLELVGEETLEPGFDIQLLTLLKSDEATKLRSIRVEEGIPSSICGEDLPPQWTLAGDHRDTLVRRR